MLDNAETFAKSDPENALGVLATYPEQTVWEAKLANFREFTGDSGLEKIVVSGMGGSALAALFAKNWLDHNYDFAKVFEISRDYSLPASVDAKTLVIIFSVSGNTEETLSSLGDAFAKNATIVIVSAGGELIEIAKKRGLPFVQLDKISQPRYGTIMHLRALAKILESYNLVRGLSDEISRNHDFLTTTIARILPNIPTSENFAKQIAKKTLGKTPIIYASNLFAPLAYKWKISFNENAKSTSWMGEATEFYHNEFIGWSGHNDKVKNFAVIRLHSALDNPQIAKRFALSVKFLGDNRPAPIELELNGSTYLEQSLSGIALADFASVYLAALNDVDPTPVKLAEDFKKELAEL
jgi:glucose/mannose-6-phosphate isomerase